MLPGITRSTLLQSVASTLGAPPLDTYWLNGEPLILNGQYLTATRLAALSGTDLSDFQAVARASAVPRMAVVSRASAQNVPNVTTTAATFSGEALTNIAASVWSSGDNTKLLIPSELNGLHGVLVASVWWTALTTRRDVYIRKNNTADISWQQQHNSQTGNYEGWVNYPSVPQALATGDYFQVTQWQNAGVQIQSQGAVLSLVILEGIA